MKGEEMLKKWISLKSVITFFGMVLSVTVLPRFLKAVLFLLKKEGLSLWQIGLCTGIGFLLAGILGYMSLGTDRKESGGWKEWGRRCAFWMVGFILPMAAGTFFINQVGSALLSGMLGSNVPGGALWAFWILTLLLEAVLIGYFAQGAVLYAMAGQSELSLSLCMKKSLRGAGMFMIFGILAVGTMMGYTALMNSFVIGMGKSGSVNAYLMKVLLISLPVTAVLYAGTILLKMSASKILGEVDGQSATAGWKPLLIPGVVSVVLLLAANLVRELPSADVVEIARTQRDALVVEATVYMETDSFAGAVHQLDLLDSLAKAWTAYVKGEGRPGDVPLAAELPEVGILKYFDSVRADGSAAELVRMCREQMDQDPSSAAFWRFRYLEQKKNAADSGTKEQKAAESAFAKEVVLELACADLYRDDPTDLTKLDADSKQEIYDLFPEKYLELIRDQFALAQLKNDVYVTQKGISNADDVIQTMLSRAAEYPDRFDIQEFVLDVTEYYTPVDENRLDAMREGVLACGTNFDRLFEENLELAEYSQEEKDGLWLEEKYMLLAYYDHWKMTEATQQLTQEALAEREDSLLEEFLLSAAIANEDNEVAMGAAEKLLAEAPESPALLLDAALVAVRLEDYTKSLEYANRLAKACENPEAPAESGAYLLSIVDTYVKSDKTVYGVESLYGEFTEEQQELLDDAELFDVLYRAEMAYYHSYYRDTGKWDECLPELEDMMEKYPHVSSLYYVAGKLAEYGEKSNGKSGTDQRVEEYYKKSLEIDPDQPTVWYVLASRYDVQERYEESLEAAKKVLAIGENRWNARPSQKYHGYGIFYHALQLAGSLEAYLQEENVPATK